MDAEKHYHDRIATFERETVEPGGIVFLGSSHLEWFDTDRFLPGYRIVNRGIAGDRIGVTDRGILHRLDVSVFDCSPAQIVLHNGVNDLGELERTGTPPIDQVAACYEQVVTTIRSRLPDVPLLAVCVLPTGRSRADVCRMIPELNTRILDIATRHTCDWMDIYGKFADDNGLLRLELSYDDLHLSEAGYQIYADLLRPRLLQTT